MIAACASFAAAYGTFAAFMARFLYPAETAVGNWTYVSTVARIPQDDALVFRTPGGAIVNIARSLDQPERLMALSSTCPHLGCQVHWEGHNQRFFCPCHNGIFDPTGKAIAGPPADAGQSLLQYPLKEDGGLLFIDVPNEELAMGQGEILDAPSPAACKLPQVPRVRSSTASSRVSV